MTGGAEFSSAREARLTYRWCLREMKQLRLKLQLGAVEGGEVERLSRALSTRAREAYDWLQKRGQAAQLRSEEVFYEKWP